MSKRWRVNAADNPHVTSASAAHASRSHAPRLLPTSALAPRHPITYKQSSNRRNIPMYKIIGGDQKEYGPVSADEVRRWIAEGRLNRQSRVQPEGSAEWQPLGGFPEFAEALRAQAGTAVLPSGEPMPPVSAQIWTAQVLGQQPQLQIGNCLALSWRLLTANFGLLFAASFIVWVLSIICSAVPLVGWALNWAVGGVLYGGLYLIFLNRIRGKSAAIGDVSAGFSIAFAQLALVGLLTGMLTLIGVLCCLVIPGLYLFVAWIFSVPLVADRRLEFWSAMELSRKVVNKVWFELFTLFLLAFLPTILVFLFMEVKILAAMISTIRELMAANTPDFRRFMALGFQIARSNFGLLMVFKFVMLLNLPFALGALMYAYENLFGTRTTPPA